MMKKLVSCVVSVVCVAHMVLPALSVPLYGDGEPVEIAHAEDGNVEFLGLQASQLDATSNQDSHDHSVLTDSIIGNLILKMAYQRDPELQRLQGKQGKLAKWGTRSAVVLSGIGLTASVLSLATINDGAGGHEEGEAHEGEERDNPTSSILGVVGSGISLASIGGQMIFRKRYRKRIAARQHEVIVAVEAALETLEQTGDTQPLEALIGPRAAAEMAGLIRLVNL